MRELNAARITQAVAGLCIRANTQLPEDVKEAICSARQAEDWPVACDVLDRIMENYSIGRGIPICQDTGMACVFLKIGQEVHICGDLTAAVNEGVRQGYAEGYLRKSVVRDPLDRVNTGDNTPAMLYTELVCYEDLGAEAVRRLEVEDLPLTVVIDSRGNNLYQLGRAAWLARHNG